MTRRTLLAAERTWLAWCPSWWTAAARRTAMLLSLATLVVIVVQH